MASIIRDPNGTKRISFTHPNGGRKSVRLGKMSLADARTVKARIEAILASKISRKSLDSETAAWVRDMPDGLADKLTKAGLVEPRGGNATATGMFLDNYMVKRTDIKGGTRVAYGHTVRNLKAFLGEGKPLRSITKGDADDFQRYLIDQGLATATVNRRCGLAKTFLRAAVRHELLQRNPFEDLKGAARGNRERMRFIRKTIQQVIDACPGRIFAVVEKPNWRKSSPSTLCAPGSAIHKRWQRNIIPRSRMSISGRDRVENPQRALHRSLHTPRPAITRQRGQLTHNQQKTKKAARWLLTTTCGSWLIMAISRCVVTSYKEYPRLDSNQ